MLDLVRLGRGAVPGRRFTRWKDLRKPGALAGVRLISFDVFETILARSPGADEAVAREAAQEARRLAGVGDEGFGDSEIVARRREIEHQLRREARSRGEDPEIGLSEVNRRLLGVLAGREPDPAQVEELGAWELRGELLRTVPNDDVVELLARARAKGIRVVAVSDMYFSSVQIGWLLRQHGVPAPDRIYVSSEALVGKFSGRLFQHVLQEENVDPGQVLHVGDRLLNDVLAARELGVNAVRYQRSGARGEFRSQPRGKARTSPPEQEGKSAASGALEQAARALGENVLGPVLVSFARLLLARADRLRLDELLFVARDGFLLQQVVDLVMAAAPPALRVPTGYVYLSRRSTTLAGLDRLEIETVDELFTVTTSPRTLGAVLASLNVDPVTLAPWLSRWGFDDSDRPLQGGAADPALARLLADDDFQAAFAEEAQRQRSLLERYLRQGGLFDGRKLGLVDVGWRGSTQTSLQRAFGREPGFSRLTGCYLGLWPDDAYATPDFESREGVIGDVRRGRNPLEGAAHYASLLLEAVCRADHGSVLGYTEKSTGEIVPVLADGTDHRRAEMESDWTSRAIREGVIARARQESARGAPCRSPDRERRSAQKALLRLAFFPTRTEIDVARSLVHTERHAEGWYASLVPDEPANPILQPRKWLRQLQSPWRAGTIAQTGGRTLSTINLLLESILLVLPRGSQAAVRRSLLAAAGQASRTNNR